MNENKTSNQWLQEGREAYYIYNDKKKAEECYLNATKHNGNALVVAEHYFLECPPDSRPNSNVLLFQSLQQEQNAMANYLLADWRFRRGDKEEALQAIESGNQLKSEDMFSLFHKAWVTAKWINQEEGLYLLNKVIAMGPGYCRFYSDKADLLLTLGDSEGALNCAEEALKSNPYFIPALLLKADLMRAQGDEGCIRFYDKILAQEAHHNKALLNKSMACYEFADYDDGIATMKSVLQKNPYNKALNVDMGDLHYEIRDYETAITYYNKGDDENVNARRLNNKGLALAKLGKFEEAIQDFEKALLLSQNPLFYINRGKVHLVLKQENLAKECFNKATFEYETRKPEYSLNQKNIDFINNYTTNDGGFINNPNLFVRKVTKGNSQEKQKTADQWLQEGRDAFYIYYDKKKASECYGNATNHSQQSISVAISIAENYYTDRDGPPRGNAMLCGSVNQAENAVGLYLLADFHSQRNYIEGVEDCLEKANKLNSEDAFSLFHKALYTSKWGNPSEALEIFDKAIKLAPKYCLFYSEKAVLLFRMKNDQEALNCLEEAIKIKPFFIPALLMKGDFLRAQGNQDCIGYYTKIIIQDYTHRKALINKSMACYELKLYEEGITTMKILLRQAPNDKTLNGDMGDFYYEIGDYETAIIYYNKGPDNQARNLNNKALTLTKLGRLEEAIESFGKAISLSCHPLFLCNKGKVHIMLGQEDMALECFERAVFEAKKKNYDYPLNQRNPEFKNSTLESDRAILIERLTSLQQAIVEANRLAKKLDPKNEAADDLLKHLKTLNEERTIITDNILNKLNINVVVIDVQQLVEQNKILAQEALTLEKKLQKMTEQIIALQKA